MNHAEHKAGLAPTPGYRYAEQVGDRLYVAGQVPLDANGLLVAPRDPGGQALACLHNLLPHRKTMLLVSRRVNLSQHPSSHLTIHAFQ